MLLAAKEYNASTELSIPSKTIDVNPVDHSSEDAMVLSISSNPIEQSDETSISSPSNVTDIPIEDPRTASTPPDSPSANEEGQPAVNVLESVTSFSDLAAQSTHDNSIAHLDQPSKADNVHASVDRVSQSEVSQGFCDI